jgi:hypothetical protein
VSVPHRTLSEAAACRGEVSDTGGVRHQVPSVRERVRKGAECEHAALLPGLQLPGADDGIFDGIYIAVSEIGNHHHVFGEAVWHRERVGE